MISIISILVVLVVIGFGLWLLDQMPLDGQIRNIIKGVAIFLVIIWLLQSLGLFSGLSLN